MFINLLFKLLNLLLKLTDLFLQLGDLYATVCRWHLLLVWSHDFVNLVLSLFSDTIERDLGFSRYLSYVFLGLLL